jgi:hypothetical protein
MAVAPGSVFRTCSPRQLDLSGVFALSASLAFFAFFASEALRAPQTEAPEVSGVHAGAWDCHHASTVPEKSGYKTSSLD